MDDYYAQLGVGRGATNAELAKAYRVKALQSHPSRIKSTDDGVKKAAAKQFSVVAEAYEVLSNSERRAAFDLGGMNALKGTGLSGSTFAIASTHQHPPLFLPLLPHHIHPMFIFGRYAYTPHPSPLPMLFVFYSVPGRLAVLRRRLGHVPRVFRR